MQFLANLVHVFKNKKNNSKLYEDSFYALTGMLTGIAVNDIWRILNLPGNNEPLMDKGKPIGYDKDFGYQVLIGAGIMLSNLVGIHHSLVFGGSFILGASFANTSEQGHTVKVLPF